jgi:hypothetical protein
MADNKNEVVNEFYVHLGTLYEELLGELVRHGLRNAEDAERLKTCFYATLTEFGLDVSTQPNPKDNEHGNDETNERNAGARTKRAASEERSDRLDGPGIPAE